MKIKSLLLGPTAAMIAVSGAQAADAIIVEPEPMEYVKVCDMYGAGFFYIPGTETCININGYVRSTYTHSESDTDTDLNVGATGLPLTTFSDATNADGFLDDAVFGPGGGGDFTTNTSSWTVRGRLNFDVRNETEYGTLRSQLRLQGGDADASGDQNVAIDRALISLAGFRLGYSDTYWTTNHSYGAGTPAINDGFYDFDQGIFFDYTATLMDGVSVTVGVQDSNGGAFGASSPDIYIGMNATFGGLTIAGTAIRDDYIDINSGNSKDEWAYKGSAIYSFDNGWQIGGWYAADNGHTQYVSAYNARDIDEEWGVQVNGPLTSNLSIYGMYSEASGEADQFFLDSINFDLERTQWAVGTVWAPVSGLTVQIEYSETETDSSSIFPTNFEQTSNGLSVRVTRSF